MSEEANEIDRLAATAYRLIKGAAPYECLEPVLDALASLARRLLEERDAANERAERAEIDGAIAAWYEVESQLRSGTPIDGIAHLADRRIKDLNALIAGAFKSGKEAKP